MSYLNYQRLDNIVNLLLERKEAVHIDELSSFCNVSDRTIRTDISTINEHIEKHGAHIVLIRKKGYIIDYLDKKAFDSFWSHQDTGTFLFTTSEARLTFLIRLFLTTNDFISYQYLQSILFVSQNTLYSDLRVLKKKFSRFNLTIRNKSNLGYKVIGDEENFRNAIIDLIFKNNFTEYLTASTSLESDICNNIDYKKFKQLYRDILSKEIYLDSYYFHRNIFTTILLTISRVKSGHTLKQFNQNIQLNSSFQLLVNHFFDTIEHEFSIKLSIIERNYINYCIAENSPRLINKEPSEEDIELAQNITTLIISTLKNSTKANWVEDDILRTNLLEHIKLFIKIQTIDGKRNNPLLDTIKNNFAYAFDLAINCSREVVKKYSIHFTEDEISYIALHLANAIERNEPEVKNKISLAIVCGAGRTFSSIIEAKIKRRFPNIFSTIKKFSYENFSNHNELDNKFNLIVTTVPIRGEKSNVVYIQIDDLDSSMKKINNKINELTTNSNIIPEGLLNTNHFYVIDNKVTKEDILNYLFNELVSQGYVKDNFLSEIYERENISSTIISDSIAIPHPIGDSVITSTIATVIAPKGISWDGKLIKFLFLFAIKADEPEKMAYFYDCFLDFISSEKLQSHLLKEPTFDTLAEILQEDKRI